jgi:pre-rRNA-processing protein TSR2
MSATTTTGPTAFTPLQTSKWELGVSLILNFWPALTDAVNSNWGGPDSSDKRDWLCGHIADLWDSIPDADEFEIESTLVQVMEDEFEVALEDDSAFEVDSSSEQRESRG